MSEKTHWLQSPNKNYLGHWDLPESGEMVVTIESAQWEAVTNPIINKTESKRVVRFTDPTIKPWICNEGNAQDVVRYTGVKWMDDSKGHSICLCVGKYTDKRTKIEVDCIRLKARPSINADDLRTLFDLKVEAIPPDDLDAVEAVIKGGDPSKYQRVYNYLRKL